jgi:cystathionine beta-lyase
MRPATRLIHFDRCPGDPFKPMSTPIYQTATFEQESATEFGPYDYSRSGNPTRAVLERLLADLDGASRAFAFGSGMAAVASVCRLAGAGGHVVAGDDLYGGSFRLLGRVLPSLGIRASFADASDPAAVAAAIRPDTRLVLVETPTNPLLRVADVRALAALSHARGALLAVDNSLLTPCRQRPLELGADLAVMSATKHLGGHGDVTAGVVAAKDPALAEKIAFLQNAEGSALGPFDSWLLLRGLKTLALRVDREEANARRVAEFLRGRPPVTRVHWAGFEDHPGRAVHARQASGAGSVLSFETGSFDVSRKIVESLRLFKIAVSFGSVCSQASLPCRMSHASVPAELRASKAPLPEDLVRLSVGIEDPEDLLEDLAQALDGARRTV